MGQTPSKDQQYADLYSSYIQQQQNLIAQQQSQINGLYQMNLESQHSQPQQSQHQMPPNMIFQQEQCEQQQEQYEQQNNNSYPQLPSARPKLDPYQILKVSKDYDEKSLKKAYLKVAMKAHPDRGGSAQAFQQVSIAFTVLQKKLKERENNHMHNDLRDGSKEYVNNQSKTTKVNVNMTENFDADVFNRIYDENKIPDVYDEGYGSWMNSNPALESGMNSNPALESGQTKMFQNGFNKDMFNSTFDNYKREQSQRIPQNQLVTRDPEVKISMANADSLMTLGQDKITNFSGQSQNLNYTDYKQAFTDGSTLIDINSVDTSSRSNSIGGIKSQRSNISYQMSNQDQQLHSQRLMLEKNSEQDRINRLNVYDQQHGQAYERIHSMLLR
jgi:curved DNA-binding protein CbpA